MGCTSCHPENLSTRQMLIRISGKDKRDMPTAYCLSSLKSTPLGTHGAVRLARGEEQWWPASVGPPQVPEYAEGFMDIHTFTPSNKSSDLTSWHPALGKGLVPSRKLANREVNELSQGQERQVFPRAQAPNHSMDRPWTTIPKKH